MVKPAVRPEWTKVGFSLSLEVLGTMSTQHPLSLGEVKRLAGSADTIRLRASRDADLETPIGAFLRLDDGTTPAYLLESVEGGERLGRYSFLGVGPRRLLEVRDGVARIQDRPVGVTAYAPDLPVTAFPAPDPLDALRAFVPRRAVEPGDGMPRFTGGAVGALAYDAVSVFEPTVPLPSADPVGVPLASFIETDLVLVFDHLTHELSAIASLHTDAPRLEERYRIAERAIFEALEQTARPSAAEIAGVTASAATASAATASAATASAATASAATASGGHAGSMARVSPPATPDEPLTSLGRDAFEAAVRAAKDAIASGEAIQVVLARRETTALPAGPDGRPIDGIGLYRALRRVNPSPYLFFVRTPSFEVVGASPELLLQVEGDRMTTHPIAGTRPRGATLADDARLAEELAADPKERAEHVMLVDLGRNDLGRVARPGTVRVSKYMEVERYSHVLHLVSHVEGRLAPGLDALDALRSVFPAGTLSGAPKVRAMQLIAAAERERRGVYGGAIGYLGYDGNLDTAIAIRSAVLKDGVAHLHAGAGIVAGSVPEREFEETEHKAAALRRALELAAGAGRGTAAPGAAGANPAGAATAGVPDRAGPPDPAGAATAGGSR
jgi:anthranilate synthase component 1